MAQEQAIFDVGFRVSPQEESRLQQRFAQLEQKLRFGGPFSKMAKDTQSFTYQLDRATQRVITLGTAFSVLATANRVFRDIVRSTVETEKALSDINSIFKLTNENLAKFGTSLFNISRETAKSFGDVSKAAAEFARQGLSVAETQRRTRDALILSRDANIDVAESSRALTTAINSFNKEALSSTQIINRLAVADSAFAISSSDLADALTRVGSAAADVGVNFNQLIGLVTSAQQITGRGGATIAGALNTIFTRINRRDTLEALRSLGVEITNVRGEMLPTLTVLQNFAATYDKLTGSTKNYAAELVGGVRQLNVLKALLDDLGRSNSVFAQTQELLGRTTNEAEIRNAARNRTLAALGSQLSTTGQQIGSNIGQAFAPAARGILQPLLNNPITGWLQEANGQAESMGGKVAETFLKGFGNAVVYGIGPIILSLLSQVSKRVFTSLTKDIKDITLLNRQETEREKIQRQIVTLQQMGGAALQNQLSTMTSLVDKAAVLNRLLMAGSSNNPAVLAGAVQSLRRGTPKAAGGYIPMAEEAAAIAAGIGGASRGAKPVYLPGFNRGGGQFGIVANSDEWMTPGGAIYNRNMIRSGGLPPGSTPVAAGGFIPNAPTGYRPGDLRYQAGTVGDIDSGFFVPKEQIREINKLFREMGKASTLEGAYKFSARLTDIGLTLDKVSSKDLLGKVAKGLDEISFRARIVTDQSRRASPAAMAAFEAERQAAAGFGDDYMDWVRSRGQTGRGGGIVPPMPPISPAAAGGRFSGWWRNNNQRLGSGWGALGLGIGLPFLGGMVPEGQGGTAAGAGLGALGRGLSLAGTGATVGSLIPGIGTLGGLAGGAVLGALWGASEKLTKSFEELSEEIDTNRRMRGEEATAAAEVVRLQQEGIAAARAGQGNARLREILTAQRQAFAKIRDPQMLAILSNLNDPLIAEKVASRTNSVELGARPQENFLAGIQKARGGFWGTEIFGAGMSKNEVSASAGLLSGAFSGLSAQQLKDIESLARTNPEMAALSLARNAGLSRDQISGLKGDLYGFTFGENRRGNLQQVLLQAAADASGVTAFGGKAEAQVGAASENIAQTIRDIQNLQREATRIQINAEKTGQLTQIRQQIALNNPQLSDIARLRQSGLDSSIQIRAEAEKERQTLFLGGKANLLKVLQDSNISDKAIFDMVRSISSPSGIVDLQNRLNTPEGRGQLPGAAQERFLESLSELSNQLERLNLTEKANLEVNDEGNKLRLEELKLSKTFEGARRDYRGAAMFAGSNLRATLDRFDTPDRALDAIVKSNLASLDDEFNAKRGEMSWKEYQGRRLGITANAQAVERINENAAVRFLLANPDAIGAKDLTGSQIQSGLFSGAREAGLQGKASKSFVGGFQSIFAGIRRDMNDLSALGARVADNLQQSFGDAWGDFVTGAKKGKDAFRDFAISVLADTSRALGSKALQGLLSFIPGFGTFSAPSPAMSASGGPIGLASGGMVPALLTGGEFRFSPQAARRIGYDTLKKINGYDNGGIVQGGSGVRDDVPAMLPSGSFIVRKSVVNKLGPDYLQALADGKVQRRFWGGALLGALLGGGIGYATGGKKGMIGGALLGGIGGGFLQNYMQTGDILSSGQGSGFFSFAKANAASLPTLSVGQKALLGLGLSGGIGLLAAGIGERRLKTSSPISMDQVPAYRRQLEAEQTSLFDSNRGKFPYLQVGPQGQNYIAGFGEAAPTRRWDTGGTDVAMPIGPMRSGSNNQPLVNIKIDINNNGTVTSVSNNQSELSDESVGRLEKLVKSWTQEEIVNQSRSDGFLSQKPRFINRF